MRERDIGDDGPGKVPETTPTVLGEAQARLRKPGEARLALMRDRGVSLSNIARYLERDLSVVSRVNRGQRRSKAIEQEIARQLGLFVADAFPEWYRGTA